MFNVIIKLAQKDQFEKFVNDKKMCLGCGLTKYIHILYNINLYVIYKYTNLYITTYRFVK